MTTNNKLIVARTLMHELIHAVLWKTVDDAGGYPAIQQAMTDGKDEFTALWEYVQQYGEEEWQHEYMADKYVTVMAQGMKEVHHKVELNRRFFNMMNETENFSWTEFYYYLAWEGLQDTDEFKSRIQADPNLYELFVDYLRDATMGTKCN